MAGAWSITGEFDGDKRLESEYPVVALADAVLRSVVPKVVVRKRVGYGGAGVEKEPPSPSDSEDFEEDMSMLI